MNFGYDSLIGISAAFLTTLSFLPQIVKAYRTRRMKDVSRYLMILFSAGSILWIIYGIIHDDLVIVGANVTAAVFNLGIVLCMDQINMSRRITSAKINASLSPVRESG
ncbi:MAG: SemiSWEET family transporter [Thermoproteota archaeon]|nr:SemiSWEET family transporter [Thermoproteota archaeon]